MKKFFTVLALASVIAASAQKNGNKPVEFGLKAGVNFSNIRESGGGVSVSYSSLTNFVGGATALYNISNSFGIQGELLYTGSGAKANGDKIVMSYLSIPVLAKYKVTNSGLGIFAGPQIGFLLSAKDKPSSGSSVDVKNSFKSSDFSGILGADYSFKGGFKVDARYQIGLSDISASGAGNSSTVKNTGFQITVGYTFK